MNKYYAGIGSREVDQTTARIMRYLAVELSKRGYILRSGAAQGSDQAFQKGVIDNGTENTQIWLPWRDFEKEFTDQYPQHRYRLVGDECTCGEADPEAWDSVERFHPNFKKIEKEASAKYYMRFMRFMSRNYRQVIGWGEPDSQFIVCWTPEGKEVGGTAQAIRIAKHHHIPVFNLFNMSKSEVLKEIEKLNLLQ